MTNFSCHPYLPKAQVRLLKNGNLPVKLAASTRLYSIRRIRTSISGWSFSRATSPAVFVLPK
jgi:hypothetical protein